MGKQLDRERDFATIHGDTEGRHFEQDGTFFDAHGKPWVPPKPAPEAETEDAPAKPKK